MRKLVLAIVFSVALIGCNLQKAGTKQPIEANGNISVTSKSINYDLKEEILVSHHVEGGFLKCEPSTAIFGNNIVVAWNDSNGGKRGAKIGVSIGWAFSKDRGKTFEFGGYLPESTTDMTPAGADSWLHTDSEGNFYLQVLSWQNKSHHIQMYLMPYNKLGIWEQLPDAVTTEFIGTDFEKLDKPAMAINGVNIGIVYTSLTQVRTIKLVLSKNKGKTWLAPIKISTSSEKTKTGASVAIINNKIVVSWMEGNGLSLNEVWSSVSNDGGKTFSLPVLIYNLTESLKAPNGYALGVGPAADIANNTWITNDKSGNIYLTLVEGEGKASKLVMFQMNSETDQWSSPIEVDTKSKNSLKVFPSIATIKGLPAILYYYRDNAESDLTDVYLSILEEKDNFKSFKLNNSSSNWAEVPGDKEFAPIQRNFGDYITLASDDNSLVAVWTDGRSGKPSIYSRVLEIK